MRRSLSGAAALVAVLGVPISAVLANSDSPAKPPTGSVYVSTLPAGAEVYVDGTYVGRSPVLVDGLGAGRHGVTMTKAGWSLRETDVTVAAGTTAFESERLLASAASVERGTIFVRGVSDDAQFWLDGTRITAKGTFAAPAGPHSLTIANAGVRTTRAVVVFPDTTTDVLARDAEAPVASHPEASVVASVDEWLPDALLTMTGKHIALKYQGHVVDGHIGDATLHVDGESVSYAGPPEMIGGKLYLPLGVLERLSGNVVRAEPKK